jgi:hypothetical protein
MLNDHLIIHRRPPISDFDTIVRVRTNYRDASSRDDGDRRDEWQRKAAAAFATAALRTSRF